MILIGLILNFFVQIVEVQVNSSCAQEIQAKAARGQTNCMISKNNAPECVRGYNIVINSISVICGSGGSGRRKRSM